MNLITLHSNMSLYLSNPICRSYMASPSNTASARGQRDKQAFTQPDVSSYTVAPRRSRILRDKHDFTLPDVSLPTAPSHLAAALSLPVPGRAKHPRAKPVWAWSPVPVVTMRNDRAASPDSVVPARNDRAASCKELASIESIPDGTCTFYIVRKSL